MQPENQSTAAKTPATIAPSINSWNSEYLDNLRRSWKDNPLSVSQEWRDFFSGFELGNATSDCIREDQVNVDSLIYHYRSAGHYAADLDPLGIAPRTDKQLRLSAFNLSESQLDDMFDPGHLEMQNPSKLRDIINRLDETYCKHIGVEYLHIENTEQRRWLQQQMEPISNKPSFDSSTKCQILRKLIETTALEHFCATRYIGKKRFSIEGSESLIPMIRELINRAGDHNVEVVTIGMAHRGRINVLVNILNKTYDQLFTEFEESWAEDYVGGGGDVKYHLGFSSDVITDNNKPVHVTLASNPSHLEFGHSVVLGKTRARQRIQHNENRELCIPLIIHGDASFPGQGIVAEMFNMAHLDGYTVGGTVHFIVNNQIGFTTNPRDSYSGKYCTDIAKMVSAPIFHVNGDDPEACVHAVRMAVEYRQTFHNDVVIDLWSYRKHGHNESDEPSYTQPLMYKTIRKMKSVTDKYADNLIAQGVITPEKRKVITEEVRSTLNESQQRTVEHPVAPMIPPYRQTTVWEGLRGDPTQRKANTAVSSELISKIVNALSQIPENFSYHPKLKNLLSNRKNIALNNSKIDWGLGELLAYGTLLEEGSPVRLTGQDVERGTFSHRHAVIVDTETDETMIPLNSISDDQALMCVHNSPLTESACLGFEYGYSLGDPQMLVVWEAQFGDFANGAQVIIDQFIASAEVKWKRASGLVMLLPHGYEGQGPEHSSARLERFLALCANHNMSVIFPTTPAQIFHALRRQIKWNFRKPLVVMSPKSLLRHSEATSLITELTEDGFRTVIDEPNNNPSIIKRVIFCSGKIYYDLIDFRRRADKGNTIAIVRIEELYPFPEITLNAILNRYPVSEFMFVQEEPENMGAWRYIDAAFRDNLDIQLTRVCRRPCSSPAVASNKMHNIEQRRILIEAIGLPTT
ncbi:MAG: 2-oxoglutarate dehydrogenase E1 component [Phycisphaerales bacterium]|jgi:2-oxoglutarate dehydrogenase E1 component|nr:2-oxoglutarate dehydrogenase E1 component [Phycisphaerales bacterium]